MGRIWPLLNYPHQLLEAEIKDLSQFTKDIAAQPYDPESWLNRGHCLRTLGFPELALGDAYKARLLVEAALEDTSILGSEANKLFAEKVLTIHLTHPAWKAQVATPELLRIRVKAMLERIELQVWTELMEGLMASNCCSEYLKLSKEAVAKFPDDQFFPSEVENAESWFKQRQTILEGYVAEGSMDSSLVKPKLLNGSVYPIAYPWMMDDILSRSDALIETIALEFKSKSLNCTISKSMIRDISGLDGTPDVEIDVLGVIATKNIAKGETLILDHTVAVATRNTQRCAACCGEILDNITNGCCGVIYCSPSCCKTSSNFHPALCGKNFTFLDRSTFSIAENKDFSLESLLLLRVLAISIQENASHPLKTSIIECLTPAYPMSSPQLMMFNYHDHITVPIRILTELGVDVFTNPLYDTWVLHTIRCRIENNKHGRAFDELTAINTLYSMFNHSCAPNVDWRHDDNNSTVTLFAERDIIEGEELFDSYIALDGLNKAARQQKLMPWLGMDCACSRCKSGEK